MSEIGNGMDAQASLIEAPATAIVPRAPRNRARENAGKGPATWRKHDIITSVVNAQASALRYGVGARIKAGRGIIIDMHAADGEGVEQPQSSLFGANPSRTTAELSVMLARKLGNTDVVLCERNADRRAALEARWPDVPVLRNHRLAINDIADRHAWGVIINDPDGPADHGVEHMVAMSARLSLADFIVAFNEAGWRRVNGYAEKHGGAMAAYQWMGEPLQWARRLKRKQVAVSRLVTASNGFHYRILVIANHLAQGVTRNRLFEVLTCK